LYGCCIFLINKRTISSSSALHGAQDRKALDWGRKQQQAKQQLQAPTCMLPLDASLLQVQHYRWVFHGRVTVQGVTAMTKLLCPLWRLVSSFWEWYQKFNL
jgi:hypothetical protein